MDFYGTLRKTGRDTLKVGNEMNYETTEGTQMFLLGEAEGFVAPPPPPPPKPPAPFSVTDLKLNTKQKKMLARLEQGPLSTVESETFLHRGQAVIGSLRDQGYEITTSTVNGEDYYVYKGIKIELVKVDAKLQDAYYTTSHWKNMSRKRREFDGNSCCQCGNKEDLEVHHWKYELFSEDYLRDLTTLCKTCHSRTHEYIRGSEVHFPNHVSKGIADRIKLENELN